jgi:hypothetical protein
MRKRCAGIATGLSKNRATPKNVFWQLVLQDLLELLQLNENSAERIKVHEDGESTLLLEEGL